MRGRASAFPMAAYAVFLGGLAWVSRAPSFSASVLDSDEGVYLSMARALLRGAMPYTEVWDHKPPGVYVLFATFLGLFGESVFAIRIGATLAVAATALLVARLAERLWGRVSLGVLAGGLYVLAAARGPALAANTEILFAPFAVSAWLLLCPRADEEAPGSGRVFLAGLCAGIAVQVKFVAVFEIIALGVWMLLRGPVPTRERLRPLAVLGAGACVPFALVVTWFLSSGLFSLYLSTNFAANLRYAAGGRVPDGVALGEWRTALVRDGPLWVAAALFAVWPSPGNGRRGTKLFVGLLAAGEAAGALAAGRYYGHYLVEILPALAVAGAGAAARLLETRPRVRALVGAGAALATALWAAPIAAVSWRHAAGLSAGPDTVARVAELVRKDLRPGDTLWVPFWEPTTYFLVDARAATRFVMPATLLDDSIARAAGVDRGAELRRILASRPTWVVAMERPPRLDGIELAEAILRPALAADYEPCAVVDGVEIFRRR